MSFESIDLLAWAISQRCDTHTGLRALPLTDGRVARGVVLGATADWVLMDRGKVPACLIRQESP